MNKKPAPAPDKKPAKKPAEIAVPEPVLPTQKPKKPGPKKKVPRIRGITKTEELALEKRRAIVASNLLAGLNYRDMAVALNVSLGTIAHDVGIILARWREEQVRTIGDITEIELRRLDTMLNAVWADAKSGKLGHIDRVIRIDERRARILGTDAPTEANVNLLDTRDANDLTDDELAAIASGERTNTGKSGGSVTPTKASKKKPR